MGAGALLALVVAWSLWTVWSANRHLRDVEEHAEIMRAALVRGDVDGARKAMVDYQDAAAAADDITHGLAWKLFGATPWLGDDAEGVAVVASVLDDIGQDALPPVMNGAHEVTADAFQPKDGVFPVERIRAMVQPARRSEQAFTDAADRLGAVDSSGFTGPVATRFDTLTKLVDDARDTLGSTYRASRLLPRLLGDEQPRYYLLVLQNNAEMRSSGGLPGSLTLVRAAHGRVDIVRQEDMSDIGEATRDLRVPVTDDERRVFGPRLATIAVNATLTPDLDRSAALIRGRWQAAGGRPIDGLVFVDPVAVSYLMRGTGQVAVRGYPPVGPTNVVAAVEHGIYLDTPDRDQQSAYQQAVAKAVFNSFAAGRGDSVEALRGLVTAVGEGRLRLHFFDRAAQAEIAGTQIAGSFTTSASTHPQAGIYINDAGPTKMQYFLRYQASLTARSCTDDGGQRLSGSVEFVNTVGVDPDLPPSVTGANLPGQRVRPGEQLLVVYVTSPVGGKVTSLSIDGQRVPIPAVQRLDGHEVATVGVRIDPGKQQSIAFEMESGPDQQGDPRLEVTPGAFSGSSNATIRSACTIR